MEFEDPKYNQVKTVRFAKFVSADGFENHIEENDFIKRFGLGMEQFQEVAMPINTVACHQIGKFVESVESHGVYPHRKYRYQGWDKTDLGDVTLHVKVFKEVLEGLDKLQYDSLREHKQLLIDALCVLFPGHKEKILEVLT